MALSGSTGSNVGSYWRLELDWSATQNIGGNYSDVSVSLYWVSTRSTSGVSSSATKSGYIIIDGTRTDFTATAGLSGNQRKRIATASKRVSHGSDGAKSFSISANFGMAVTLSGTYYGSRTISGTWSLNTIPRKTGVSLGNATANFGGAIRINFDRKSSSFTHTVSYSFGGRSEVLWDKITWSNADWNVPVGLMSEIPNTTSGWGNIHVDTYNGSTNLGRNSARFTLNVPSNIIPSFSSLTASETNGTVSSAGIGAYIQGMSAVKLTINGASGTYGSTIKNYSINFDGQVKGNNGIWNPTFTGSKTATATITDSRGRTASKSISIAVIGYSPPVISNVSVSRVQADTTKVNVTRAGSISSLNGKNQVRVIVESSPKGTNTWGNASESLGTVGSTTFNGTVTLANTFDLTKSFDIRIRAIDKFNTVTTTASLSSAFSTLSLASNGVGIGKLYETSRGGSLQVAGEAIFDGIIVPHGGFASVKLPANSDLDNVMTTGFYYNNSTAESATILNVPYKRAFSLLVERHAGWKQTFTNYEIDAQYTWVRNHYNGVWGSWVQTVGTMGSIGISYQNGWGNYGGIYPNGHYWKDSFGYVHLRGMIEGGGKPANSVIGNLPSGYRPLSREVFLTVGHPNVPVRIDIEQNGNILASTATQGWVSLSGISFGY